MRISNCNLKVTAFHILPLGHLHLHCSKASRHSDMDGPWTVGMSTFSRLWSRFFVFAGCHRSRGQSCMRCGTCMRSERLRMSGTDIWLGRFMTSVSPPLRHISRAVPYSSVGRINISRRSDSNSRLLLCTVNINANARCTVVLFWAMQLDRRWQTRSGS